VAHDLLGEAPDKDSHLTQSAAKLKDGSASEDTATVMIARSTRHLVAKSSSDVIPSHRC
jgi:hypothetical protein